MLSELARVYRHLLVCGCWLCTVPRCCCYADISGPKSVHGLLTSLPLSEGVTIPKNPRTERSVGYAFVDLSTPTEAERAIAELSGKEILERKVSVQLARKPEANAEKTDANGEGEGNRRRQSTRGRGRGARARGGRAGRAREVRYWPTGLPL